MTESPSLSIPFDKHRFSSAAAFYDAYRVAYDEAVIAWAAREAGVDRAARVLDLGCGPGSLAVPLARLAGEVVGLDPEPAMLAMAAERAGREKVAVRLVEGSSNDLSVVPGPFRLVTMGRSFHWMDRAATLAALDGMVDPGGAVALFGDTSPRTAGWWDTAGAIAQRLAPDGMTARVWRGDPAWAPHEAILLASPFCALERYGRLRVERIGIDHVVGRLLSLSSTSPHRLGERRGAFEAEVREALAPMAGADGLFEQIVETTVLLARRA
ncbi:MAG: methyltransferase domain-containing protein [Alsobacter sp.]